MLLALQASESAIAENVSHWAVTAWQAELMCLSRQSCPSVTVSQHVVCDSLAVQLAECDLRDRACEEQGSQRAEQLQGRALEGQGS